mgnify:CR=1 FL=1
MGELIPLGKRCTQCKGVKPLQEFRGFQGKSLHTCQQCRELDSQRSGRNRRVHKARSRTVGKRDLERMARRKGDAAYYPEDIERPVTRGDCLVCVTCQAWRDEQRDKIRESSLENSEEEEVSSVRIRSLVGQLACGHTFDEAIVRSRPCLFVSCSASLYLDVQKSKSLRINFPDLEPDQMVKSCVLDIADGGGLVLEDVAETMNLTRERIRQIEEAVFKRLRKRQFLKDAIGE